VSYVDPLLLADGLYTPGYVVSGFQGDSATGIPPGGTPSPGVVIPIVLNFTAPQMQVFLSGIPLPPENGITLVANDILQTFNFVSPLTLTLL
jgi:hypothetical protein